VHADCLLLRKDSCDVGHDGGLVESRLTVNEQDISSAEVSVNYLATYLELVRDTFTLLGGHITE
jgi:hypothetical protein